MKLDRDSNTPLYLQLKNVLVEKIRSGELKPGSFMQTECEICREYGISRYPVRQALGEMADEGYLKRVRGKGTMISTELPKLKTAKGSNILGLILGRLTSDFCKEILAGFEKQARKRGYLTVSSCSEGMPDEEIACIDRMMECNISGLFVFPCNESRIESRLGKLKEKGIFVGILDRNPGLRDIDYVGSDNQGGAYTAVRHLALQGFRNVVFVSDMSNVSSINERMEGYLKAVEDYGLNSLSHINVKEDLGRYSHYAHRFFIEKFKEELIVLRQNNPIGIFAVNDHIAIQCVDVLESEGMTIGKEVGIVGFDNIARGEYLRVPLTTIAQNGFLLGQSAADIAIDKIEGKTCQVYRTIVPTQLIVRNSCGEKFTIMR
jgi:GntR family transcriptional regulator of arabinose operon